MAGSLQGYLEDLRAVLQSALCLHNFPSPDVERHNKPVIELAEPASPLVLPPVTVERLGAQVRRRTEHVVEKEGCMQVATLARCHVATHLMFVGQQAQSAHALLPRR